MALLSRGKIEKLGFLSVGQNVSISDKVSIYGASRIKIGSNVRIDDFCVLSAGKDGIEIESNIHIAVYTLLIGAGRIFVSDFANLSSRVSIYSSSDDYSGATMTNPTIPDDFKKVCHASVFIGRHVIIGSGSVVLPGVRIEEGAAIGALSLVNRNCDTFGVYAGNPARRIKDRQRGLLELEKQFLRLSIPE
jgi:acetyltransferase-like isoleucine patch superfamily enzyme